MAITELQLVCVTAMFIASNYEEKYVPVVRSFVYITCMPYSSAEIIQKERDNYVEGPGVQLSLF